MDIRLWLKELITDFINMYKCYPCLWKIKSDEYKNRNLRDEAYKTLIEFCKMRGFPDANRDFIVKKIQSLRGSFRKETKKIQESQHSGRGTEETYVSSLWYYDLLLFTKDQELSADSVSNIDTQEDIQDARNEENKEEEESEIEESSTSRQNAQKNDIGTVVQPAVKPKKRKIADSHTEFLEMCTATLKANNQPINEFDAIGINVSKQLAKMEPVQAVYAEYLINNILQKGLLNKLTDETKIVQKLHSNCVFTIIYVYYIISNTST
ncbi:hypothetical protein DMN91_002393 [Ooceraea biroi]|uniref:MADF domain-containing protein n=1 Tax=Ooceraea biroi TaxID=2015173 RepID=A0A3L8DW55_OOCBI|nr:uncharacterized protein LOC105278600 [Ooceraea biroi]RLU24305.1 hypothetical protein DMN91_002393 [Ooceraea biroi]